MTEPFRRIVVTRSGYKCILTFLYPSTKFPEVVPLKEVTSATVIDAMLTVFSRVGFSTDIQTDQARVFVSELTTTFLERLGAKITHSSVYHPQSNSVDKVHSVFKRLLRALCEGHKVDWETCLPGAMFALRTVPHQSTGFCPAALVYGRCLRTPLKVIKEIWEGREPNTQVVGYVLSLLNRMKLMQHIVESNMKQAQSRAKTHYDRHARHRAFHEGDKVMILRTSRKNKLQIHWDGPAIVKKKL